MARQEWIRLAVPTHSSFGMFNIDLGLLGKSSDDDHALASRFLENLYECALKTTTELVHQLIVKEKLITYSPKAGSLTVFAPVRKKDTEVFLNGAHF